MTSLTLHTSGVELSLLTKEVLARNPAVFVCDAPVDLDVEPFLKGWRDRGWAMAAETAVATQFGDVCARTRCVIHGEHPVRCPVRSSPVVISSLPVLFKKGLPMKPCLLAPGDPDVQGAGVTRGVIVDTSIRTTASPLLPCAWGKVGEEMVYRVDGPAPTVLPSRRVLVNAPTRTAHVRALVTRELWRCAGG